MLEFFRARINGTAANPPDSSDPKEILFWEQQMAQNNLRIEGDDILYKGTKIVPSTMREEVFKAAHGHPTAGLMGTKRTHRRIRSFYYWFIMGKDVTELKRK